MRTHLLMATVGLGLLVSSTSVQAADRNYISGYSNGRTGVYGWPGYEGGIGFDYYPGYRYTSPYSYSDALGITTYADPGDDRYPDDQVPYRSPAYRGLGFGDQEYYGGYGFPRYGRWGNQGSNGYYW